MRICCTSTKSSTTKVTLVASLALSVVFTSTTFVKNASAESFFQKIFRSNEAGLTNRQRARLNQRARDIQRRNRELRQRQRVLQQQPIKRVVKSEKINGPSYYTYRPDAIAPVRFAKLATKLQKSLLREEAALTAADTKLANAPTSVEATSIDTKTTASVVSDKVSNDNGFLRTGDFITNPANDDNSVELDGPKITFADGLDALKTIRLRAEKKIGSALLKHYQDNPKLIWIGHDGKPNEHAIAVERVLADADVHGLRPQDYERSLITGALSSSVEVDMATVMQYEMLLSTRVLRYLSDAKQGAINPNRISGYHDFPRRKVNFNSLISEVSKSSSPADMLEKAHPSHPAYVKLKAELASLAAVASEQEASKVPTKVFIKPGTTNDALPAVIEAIKSKSSEALLEKHSETLALNVDETVYNKALVKFVKGFQREKKLGADGIIGKNTMRRVVGVTPQSKIERIKFAMERLRWHPDNFGKRHVFINQASFTASYVKDYTPTLSMRVVVGKNSNQTSYFHDQIESVVFNPYWGLPKSILINEMLPKLRRNPGWFDNNGYEVTARGKRVSSYDVDWYSVGANSNVWVRQTPGPKNALGRLKILFPNKHAIYMHDTPARSLFKRTSRAFSHGCIRLHDPEAMAAAVLGTDRKYIRAKIAGGENKTRKMKHKTPVYVSYFTAWPKEKGGIGFYGDVYGRDKALTKAFKAVAKSRAAS